MLIAAGGEQRAGHQRQDEQQVFAEQPAAMRAGERRSATGGAPSSARRAPAVR